MHYNLQVNAKIKSYLHPSNTMKTPSSAHRKLPESVCTVSQLSFAGNTRRSSAFEPLMYLVSVGSVLMEAKHDGIANEIVGARES